MLNLMLPGGLLLEGELYRDYAFKPVTGRLERVVAESGDGIHSLAEQITKILVNAMDRIAGRPPTKALVRALSSGDRECLILGLQALINPEPRWLTLNCTACHEPVQFNLRAGELPVKSAGASFPQAMVTLSAGEVTLRVPTGADEEAIAKSASDHQSAMKILLTRLLSFTKDAVDIDTLTSEDHQIIDRQLDHMSPRAAHCVSITCPYCELAQELPVNNYAWIVKQDQGLEEEIHTLASNYHWSEKEILSLPKRRRKNYIKLVNSNLETHFDTDQNY